MLTRSATTIAAARRFHASALRAQQQHHTTNPVTSKLKQVDAHFRKIGDETTPESQRTMRTLRRVGVLSVAVALGSLVWALTYVSEPAYEQVDGIVDLGKDVRKTK